ncbi:MAG: VapC toxin family domain ribonuclease [Glaciihabitans sp.]|jgi:predicted nucleic acid-binding protein|nr:VapC toxin family domain ribonuclease [Glaciihabitans sp.]
MIAYFDTSAFVPLLIEEPRSAQFGLLWDRTDTVVATRLLYVEMSSALSRARRAERISVKAHGVARSRADRLWSKVVVIDVSNELMLRSSQIAELHALRGYEAIHCAAAELIFEADVVAASADVELLAAWRALGLTTFDGLRP